MQLAKRLYKTAKAGVIGSTSIEIMVKEATNSDACGPAGTTLSELSDLVSKSHEHRQEALQTLLTRLELPAENWCKIYKALLVIEYLAKNSVNGVVEDLKDVIFGEIERKVKFKFVALETGRDEGAQVRAKAAAIVNLLNDAELLGKEREAAVAAEAEKMGSGGSKPRTSATPPPRALYDAACNGNTSEVVALLSNPVARWFINWQDKDGCTPIYVAAQQGQTAAVKELISAGCDINLASKEGCTPIYVAAQQGQTGAVKELISARCDINLASKNGQTPIWAAASKGRTDAMKELISEGCDINLASKEGCTPIYVAAQQGQTDAVKELISAGCDKDLASKDGQTPIWAAASKGRTDAMKELISARCDMNLAATKSGQTPIWAAACYGQTDAVKELISARCDINRASKGGQTPIYTAVAHGQTDAVKELIFASCDMNLSESKDGMTPIYIAAYHGITDAVKVLIDARCDINRATKSGKMPLQVAEQKRHSSIATLIRNEAKRLEQEAAADAAELAHLKTELQKKEEAERNIVGKDKATILEAVQKNLVRKSPQDTRMVGIMKDLQTGKFADSAHGFKKFLNVPTGWAKKEECEVPKLEEEVRRLADCAECAKVQVQVLQDMVDEGREDLRGTLELTKELILVLEDLQFYRRKGNRKEDETIAEKEVQRIRKEIDSINGWYYGRQNAPAVAWPQSQVTHDWGKYGQPMCVACKKYGLDHSMVSADFNYVLYETSSEKEYPNGVRDQGREGKSIDDFMKMPQSTGTKPEMMNKSEAASLRFYSSPSFPAVTIPLRDPARTSQHPLAAITYCIFTGIKKQLTLGAEDQAAAVEERIFWRGYSDLQISEDFKKHGGTEYAPMSTSTDPAVAVGYAVRKSQTAGALLMRIVTKNNLQRGMDLSWISMFPGEAERLLPPLTFMNPPEKNQEIEVDGFKLSVVEIQVTAPPM